MVNAGLTLVWDVVTSALLGISNVIWLSELPVKAHSAAVLPFTTPQPCPRTPTTRSVNPTETPEIPPSLHIGNGICQRGFFFATRTKLLDALAQIDEWMSQKPRKLQRVSKACMYSPLV